MFRYIKGSIEAISEDRITVECQGIGYDVMVSAGTAAGLQIGAEEKVYTKMIVKEDGIQMIGFLETTELSVFNHLISVSKVGPKLALAILSVYRPQEVIRMIMTSDIYSLSKISGLGKKTSERIVLELRDKFKELPLVEDSQPKAPAAASIDAEAVEGLMGLGFSRKESEEAVRRTSEEGAADLQTMLKRALHHLQKS
ncbi:MAG: Holliday junction branch migration protein RuvA [Peptostreptococcaceae bacterium]|nr:Holliday junction branch migration protein RuvA [Peptostreptococcaceae bacterium]